MLIEALKIMGVGIGIVFLVLTLFYAVIKIFMKIFPAK
ncbi:MAG: OadG-related small transporter subunit [Christensenellales bacterium]|jgi:Na+-transporting methylmalonyl-CoA/oxaloacetate decarboxylase gamma subunit